MQRPGHYPHTTYIAATGILLLLLLFDLLLAIVVFSPDGRAAWVALGETAHTIVRLDITDPKHLRVAGRVHPRTA